MVVSSDEMMLWTKRKKKRWTLCFNWRLV